MLIALSILSVIGSAVSDGATSTSTIGAIELTQRLRDLCLSVQDVSERLQIPQSHFLAILDGRELPSSQDARKLEYGLGVEPFKWGIHEDVFGVETSGAMELSARLKYMGLTLQHVSERSGILESRLQDFLSEVETPDKQEADALLRYLGIEPTKWAALSTDEKSLFSFVKEDGDEEVYQRHLLEVITNLEPVLFSNSTGLIAYSLDDESLVLPNGRALPKIPAWEESSQDFDLDQLSVPQLRSFKASIRLKAKHQGALIGLMSPHTAVLELPVLEIPAKPRKTREAAIDQNVVRHYFELGLSDKEISEEMGVKKRSVQAVRLRMGLRREQHQRELISPELVRELFTKGHSDESIADEIGVDKRSVQAVRLRMGLRRDQNQRGPVSPELVRELFMEGHSDKSIASTLKASPGTIKSIRHRLGLYRERHPAIVIEEKLRSLFAEKMSNSEIADILEVPPSAVGAALKKLGLSRRSRFDEEEFSEMFHSGHSDAEIARHFGSSAESIKQARRRRGLLRRSQTPRASIPYLSISRAAVTEMFEAGMSDENIAEELGAASSSVLRVRHELGLLRSRPPVSRELIREMFNTGHSDAEIAEEAGATLSTVRTYRGQMGLKRAFLIDKDRLEELFLAGFSDKEIAEELGANPGGVRSVRRELGLNRQVATEAQENEVHRLFSSGRSDEEISKILGMSEYRIKDIRKRRGLRREHPVTIDRAEVKSLFEKGMSDTEIAQELDSTPSTISSIRRGLGLMRRGKYRTRKQS